MIGLNSQLPPLPGGQFGPKFQPFSHMVGLFGDHHPPWSYLGALLESPDLHTNTRNSKVFEVPCKERRDTDWVYFFIISYQVIILPLIKLLIKFENRIYFQVGQVSNICIFCVPFFWKQLEDIFKLNGNVKQDKWRFGIQDIENTM